MFSHVEALRSDPVYQIPLAASKPRQLYIVLAERTKLCFNQEISPRL